MSRGGVISRREALAMAGTFVVTAACNGPKLFGPRCDTQGLLLPAAAPVARDVYVVNAFTGLQLGTKENPYRARTALEFDALLRSHAAEEDLGLHLEGTFQTKGVYRWGQYASRNLGKNWTVDGVAEVALDPAAITVKDAQPLLCLAGPAKRVSQIRTRGNHSLLAEGWTASSLRTGAVLLEGDGEIDGVALNDFGAKGAESFVAIVTQGTGPAAITRCPFGDFDPASSDTQVTVRAIMGLEDALGAPRSFALMEGNRTEASGPNGVQAHTIYQAARGLVRGNYSLGARVGYYGDYYATKGIEISDNEFLDCEHGVQLKLSPTPASLAGAFSHEDYTIGWNHIRSTGTNVSLDTCGPSTDTRFIRHMSIDPRLSLEEFGATDTTRPACLAA